MKWPRLFKPASECDRIPDVEKVAFRLVHEYQNNPLRFNLRRIGEAITVRGRVQNIAADGTVTIMRNLWQEITVEACYANLGDVVALQNKQRVSLSGTISAVRTDWRFTINLGPQKHYWLVIKSCEPLYEAHGSSLTLRKGER